MHSGALAHSLQGCGGTCRHSYIIMVHNNNNKSRFRMALGEENIIIIWKVGTPAVFTQQHATHYAKCFDNIMLCSVSHTHTNKRIQKLFFSFGGRVILK